MIWQGPGARWAPRFRCPVCRRNVLVNKDGRLRLHSALPIRMAARCAGSHGKVPE